MQGRPGSVIARIDRWMRRSGGRLSWEARLIRAFLPRSFAAVFSPVRRPSPRHYRSGAAIEGVLLGSATCAGCGFTATALCEAPAFDFRYSEYKVAILVSARSFLRAIATAAAIQIQRDAP